jgi:Calcineurin-like phosphoesterase
MTDPARPWGEEMIDPRRGDADDDASSPKQRSLLAIAGSLFAEISLPKLIFAWGLTVGLPALILGLTPLAVTAWLASARIDLGDLASFGGLVLLVILGLVAWIGLKPLLRTAEANFWTLQAVAIQPGYALCRESLQQLAEAVFARGDDQARRVDLRAWTSAGAGIVLSLIAVAILAAVWPATRWQGSVSDLLVPARFIVPMLANAVAIGAAYLAVASLAWGFADATMPRLATLAAFDPPAPGDRTFRVAHLSDVHVVGDDYGFRLECGRGGPRGNGRFRRVMERLAAIHAENPLDLVLITGDMTDAGISSEWAAFMDIVALHPELARRTLILPGNHDVNIVDRANPARLDLPFSAAMRLRHLRTLSAMDAIQGETTRVPSQGARPILREALAPWRERIVAFANGGGSIRETLALRQPWNDLFPMILEPADATGLGVVVLNSNAETHFSMTNALGLVSLEQTVRMQQAMARHPNAAWIVAVHHHVVEYPMRVHKFSERIGTALINGSWFVRQLLPHARRCIVMHGHRHVDWIGGIGGLRIISAPSPVMNGRDDQDTYFLIHTLANDGSGAIALRQPQRIDMPGDHALTPAIEASAPREQGLDLGTQGSRSGGAGAGRRQRAAG